MLTDFKKSLYFSCFFLKKLKEKCLLCSFFNDIVEGVSVKFPYNGVFLCSDGSSAGSVVQKRQLSESFAGLVGLQQSRLRFAIKEFEAIKAALFEDIHTVPMVTLLDHVFPFGHFNFFDCVNHNFEFLFVKCIKHKCLQQSLTQLVSGFFRFGYYFWDKCLFLVVDAIDLG